MALSEQAMQAKSPIGLSRERIKNQVISRELRQTGKQIAMFFQILENQDETARLQIEKEMCRWFIWVVFPKDANVTAKWNAIHLNPGTLTPDEFDANKSLYEQVHISEDAIKAIREGRPVALAIRYDYEGKLRLLVGSGMWDGWGGWGFATVDHPGGSASMAILDFECSVAQKTMSPELNAALRKPIEEASNIDPDRQNTE